MMSTVQKLWDAHGVLAAQSQGEQTALRQNVARLLDTYSASDREVIGAWVTANESDRLLRILSYAFTMGTMPPAEDLIEAIRDCESEPQLVLDYIAVHPLLHGWGHDAKVISSIRGLKDSPVRSEVDFDEDGGLSRAASIVHFMFELNGSSVVASGTVGETHMSVLLDEGIGRLAIANPERLDEIIALIKSRQQRSIDEETERIIKNDPADINSIFAVMVNRNMGILGLVQEMLQSDHGVLVDGML